MQLEVMHLQAVVWIFIFALLITGGIRGKVELSQLNVFGWIALALGLYHWRKTGRFFDKRLEKIALRLVNAVSRHPKRTLYILFGAHAFLFTWIQVNGYRSFETSAFDLGFVDQAIWSAAYLGKKAIFLHSDLSRGLQSYLSEHFSPILVAIAPLYRIWDSVYWLFAIQSLVLASGAIIIYRLAHHYKYTPAVGVLFAAVFLFYQPLRSANLFSLREDNFYVPILLGLILAFEKKHWLAVSLLAALTLTVKENAPIVLTAFAAWMIVRGERIKGAALCVLALVAFWVINSKIMPYYSGGATNTVLSSRLSPLGSNFGEIMRNVALHPFDSAYKIIEARVSGKTFKYLLTVLLPFVPFLFFKPLKTGMAALIAIALLLMNLLIMDQTVGFHYECVIIPFLFAALVYGFSKRAKQFGPGNAAALLATLTICVYGRSPMLTLREWWPKPVHHCMSQALKQIPQSASVTAQGGLYPHIDHREEAYVFAFAAREKSDFVALSRLPSVSAYPAMDLDRQISELDRRGYKRIVDNPSLYVWCKKEACAKYSQAISSMQSTFKSNCN